MLPNELPSLGPSIDHVSLEAYAGSFAVLSVNLRLYRRGCCEGDGGERRFMSRLKERYGSFSLLGLQMKWITKSPYCPLE
jgi:hypothetical protein